MKIRPLIVGAVWIALFALPLTANAQVKLTWKVLKYDIEATLPSDYSNDRNLTVAASLTLRNQTDRPFNRITLRINETAIISGVTSGGAVLDYRGGIEKLTESQNLQKIQVSVPSVPAGKDFSLVVKYKLATPVNSGLHALSPIGSQFIPYSYWYPTPTSWYFPEGPDAAPVDIVVKGLSEGRIAVSSGRASATGFSSVHAGMPFFITGKWNVSEHGDVLVYAPAGVSAIPGRSEEFASVAGEAKSFVESIFGRKIESPIRIVAVSRGSGYSGDGTIFVERGAFMTRSVNSKTVVAISEAIAKTMLGNVISVRGAGYGVIQEGLSRFVSNQFLEKKYGPAIGEITKLRQLSNYVAIADKDGPLGVVSPVDAYFYSSTGNKGAIIWNYIYRSNKEGFYDVIKANANDGELTLEELRAAFSRQKPFLDHAIDQVTSMNLMIGRPLSSGNVTKAALRNLGEIAANVRVVGFDSAGKEFSIQAEIPSKGFGEAVFDSGNIVRVEVDPEKVYPQISYKDDVSPRNISEDDPIVFIKNEFDRQKFEQARINAQLVLTRYPEFDDARVFLGRANLGLGKLTDAKMEFEKVLSSKLASSQSIAWALVGLGEVARKSGRNTEAVQFFDEAIRADAEYGTTLTARRGRAAIGSKRPIPSFISAYFVEFDKAVVANSKKSVEAQILPGEVSRFSSNVAGQAQAWATEVVAVDELDDETWLVETNLNVKLLNRQDESGLAVFRLAKVDGVLKLVGVEVFEVS